MRTIGDDEEVENPRNPHEHEPHADELNTEMARSRRQKKKSLASNCVHFGRFLWSIHNDNR